MKEDFAGNLGKCSHCLQSMQAINGLCVVYVCEIVRCKYPPYLVRMTESVMVCIYLLTLCRVEKPERSAADPQNTIQKMSGGGVLKQNQTSDGNGHTFCGHGNFWHAFFKFFGHGQHGHCQFQKFLGKGRVFHQCPTYIFGNFMGICPFCKSSGMGIAGIRFLANGRAKASICMPVPITKPDFVLCKTMLPRAYESVFFEQLVKKVLVLVTRVPWSPLKNQLCMDVNIINTAYKYPKKQKSFIFNPNSLTPACPGNNRNS